MFKPLNGKCVFCKCLQHMNYTPALKNTFACVILQMDLFIKSCCMGVGRKMKRPEKRKFIIAAAVLFLIAVAAAARVLSRNSPFHVPLSLLRSIIYISLMTAWGFSVRARIIQPQTRRYLSAISALIVFWLIIRTVKYLFASDITAERYLWYFYYLPLLFIPPTAVFVALSLGKGESFRLPSLVKLLYIPSLLLLLLVLTNDLHQLVFSFPEGSVFSDQDYSYSPGFYAVTMWGLLCAGAALVIMLFKCRIPRSKSFLWVPVVPLSLILLYGGLYVSNVYFLWLIAGDITVSMSLLIVAAFESCIACGLIQSNTGYEALFAVSPISAQITDDSFNVRFSSACAGSFPQEILSKASVSPFLLGAGTLLKGSKLHKGYVFWQEDISELNKIIGELEITQEELRDTGDVLKAESEQRERKLRLEEENRLYDLVEKQTVLQVALLREMLSTLKSTDDISKAKHILGKIVVIGTYIKRKSNLIFVERQKNTISAGELRLCLGESAANLKLCGAECKTVLNFEGQLSAKTANTIYDLFEAVIEKSIDSLTLLLLYAQENENFVTINISALCSDELSALKGEFKNLSATRDDDDLWYLSLKIGKDGESS